MNKLNQKTNSSPLISIIVIVVIIAALLAVCYRPPIHITPTKSPKMDAINKGRQIHGALHAYAQDHNGKFPTGDTAEACFNQLLAEGYIDDERIFWIKENAKLGTTNEDKINNNGTLEPGENSWGYIEGLTTESPASTPVLFDSSIAPGIFSTSTWDGKAIVIRNGGSRVAMHIDTKNNPNQGPILEQRGTEEINIFKNLPKNTQILLPTKP